MFKYGDRVVVTSDTYSCADKGATGTLVDEGYWSSLVGDKRFLVRFDGSDSLYGIHTKAMAKLV
jgi:hypothetical protein